MSDDDERIDNLSSPRTRRGVIKLAGAAAVGAVGATALRALSARAAGSGDTIDLLPPNRVLDTRDTFGPLAGGSDYDFGPFPALAGFDSTSYYGMMGNLTATGWNTSGWLSIRAHGTPLPPVSNVNFSGSLSAIPNFVITAFGAPGLGQTTDGKVTIHCGGPAFLRVHVVLDLFAYLGPDQ